jgi:3-mercaptopyruvate sulfurtransferase SseA
MKPVRLPSLIALFALLALPLAARADALGATQARSLLGDGAVAWDVRPAGEHLLPGAVRADLAGWQRHGDAASLSRAVSAAGIDLSREVVLYGSAGDPLAQALYAALTRLATGNVHWLVGGIDEWRAAGLPTAAHAALRAPVPQHWVARPDGGERPNAAAAARREPAAAPVSVVARGG